MKTSESIKQIIPALVKAQSEMGVAVKGEENPFYKSRYADLPEVIQVCKEPLNTNKIVVLQPVLDDKVVTVLLHESGEWVSDEGTKILSAKPNDPQAQGSAITYARRYGLMSMLSIPSDDDDGEKAMDRKAKAKKSETTNEPTAPNGNWNNAKPTPKQIEAILKVATFHKEISGVEEAEKLRKEVTETWTAKQASDYLGNKTDGLEGARK